jgi:hypothetical protein
MAIQTTARQMMAPQAEVLLVAMIRTMNRKVVLLVAMIQTVNRKVVRSVTQTT